MSTGTITAFLATLLTCAALVCAAPATATLPGTWPSIAVSPDGRHVYAAGSLDLAVYARDLESGRLSMIDAVQSSGNVVAISPDGGSVYATSGAISGPPVILVFQRAPDGTLLQRQAALPGLASINALAVSPDGRNLYASSFSSEGIAIYRRAADGTLAFQSRTSVGAGFELDISPDGRFLYAGWFRLRRDPGDGGLSFDADHADKAPGSANYVIAPDGSRAFGGGGPKIGTFGRDALTGELTRRATWQSPSAVESYDFGDLALSPDGAHLVSPLSQSGVLRLFRTKGDDAVEQVGEWVGGRDGSQAVGYPVTATWTPDGRSLYVGSEYSRISVWALTPGTDSLTMTQSLRSDPWLWKAPKGPSVVIDGGARYTSDATADLLVGNPGANSLQISDRPDFRGAPLRKARRDGAYSWGLRKAGPRSGLRKVYVRYVSGSAAGRRGISDAVTLDVADEIVLDQRKPLIARVTLKRLGKRRSVLRIRARDSLSGVRQIQVARVRSRPSKPSRATRKLVLRGQPRRLWIRVVDGAGNRSRWKAVRRR